MEIKKRVTKFKENTQVRVSKELYEFDRCRFKLSVHGYRLLFAIAQSLDYNQNELFPEFGFDIHAVFKYLGVENNGRRFEILKDALDNIGENWLTYKTFKKNGAIRWEGMAWITKYSFATDEALLNIKINEDVKPYLLNLTQYAAIRPKDYLNLTTEYQNWFYPYLTIRKALGKWRVAIEDLKQGLFLEKSKAYNTPTKNATENFLDRVIGIQLSAKAKLENQAATSEKRKPRPIEWDYIKDKEGKLTGTLYGITKGTDLNVTASVEKTGRSYTHIVFFISEKSKKTKTVQQAPQIAEEDLGNPNDRSKRTKTTQHIANLFKPEQMPETVPIAKVKYYTTDQVKQLAKDFNLTQALFLDRMGLKPNGDGRYFKEI
jgi:plasmid replication initiation protein